MRLSSIKTADQLILALASAGYIKSASTDRGSTANPFFTHLATCCPVCLNKRQAIWIYPQQLDHSDDLGLIADLDPAGEITGWHLVEHFAGSWQQFDPTKETTAPESIGEVLQHWQESFSGSQG